MAGGPVVLLGQGEQYDDPQDWRELVRGRRIRRGVEVAVRRDGVTAFLRPEEVPELAPILDAVDPPGPPAEAARPPPGPQPASAGGRAEPAVPLTPAGAGPSAAHEAAASGDPPAPGRRLPTAAPRRGWRTGLLWLLAGVGALLFLRLCAHDGFGPAPAFGDRAARPPVGGLRLSGAGGRATACARPKGWIAQAACDDPDFARLRSALARAYAARAAGLDPDARADLAREQARWQAARGACRGAAAPGACLAPRYRARIAELGEARAAAGAAPDARSSAPERAQGDAAASLGAAPVPGEVIARPEWLRRPSADEVADAFPERAQRLDIGGRARLSCRVTASGALTACDILAEDPPDYGFGGAALRLSRFFQLRAAGADGRSLEGARVEVPVEFRSG